MPSKPLAVHSSHRVLDYQVALAGRAIDPTGIYHDRPRRYLPNEERILRVVMIEN